MIFLLSSLCLLSVCTTLRLCIAVCFLMVKDSVACVWLALILPFPTHGPSKLVHIAEDYGASKASLSFSPELDVFPGSVVYCLCLVPRLYKEIQVVRWPPTIAKWHERHAPGFPFWFLVPVDLRYWVSGKPGSSGVCFLGTGPVKAWALMVICDYFVLLKKTPERGAREVAQGI